MDYLRKFTIYNKNQQAYEDFLRLCNCLSNKYNFLMQKINELFVENKRLIISYSETKDRKYLLEVLNNVKTIISIFDAFVSVNVLTENQYLRFKDLIEAELQYLKATLFKNEKDNVQ